MKEIHPDDNLVTCIVLEAGEGNVKEIRTPASKMHDVFTEYLNDDGYVEYMSFSEGVMVLDDYGKTHNKEINWKATFILHAEKRMFTDDFICGSAIIVGPADPDGYEMSVDVASLKEKWPVIFA